MSLIIVGTVAFDSIETPYGKAERVVGGAALYGSIAASHFTDQVQLVSIIGGDFPQQELDFMASRGIDCLLYTSPSPRDATLSRMPSSA